MDGCLGHGVRDYKGNKDIDGKEIDILKEEKAKENGYKVVRIDCKYREVDNRFDYIKTSVINSELITLLKIDIDSIDWESISCDCENSYVYKACELYNNGTRRTKEIADYLDLTSATIISYLKRGTKYGWCNYNPKLPERISSKGIPKLYNRGDKILQIDITTGSIIHEYDCLSEIDKIDGFSGSNISSCCRGKCNIAHGFIWVYKKEYDKEDIQNRIKILRRNKYKYRVKQFNVDGKLIKEYSSIMEASRETGIENTSIGRCCKEKQKTAGGYIWRYADEVNLVA